MGPRNRLVYFRLSEKEFEQLNSLCTGEEGARSVSQISRMAVRAFLAQPPRSGDELKDAIQTMSDRLSGLDGKLEQLTELIANDSSKPHLKGEKDRNE